MRKRIVWVWMILLLVSLSCKALQPGGSQPDAVTQVPGQSESFDGQQDKSATDRATPTLQSSKGRPTSTTEPGPPQPVESLPTSTEEPAATQTPLATSKPTLEAPALAGAVGETSIADDYAPELGNTGYDVLDYTIRMALDPSRVEIPAARVTIEAAAALDDLSQFSLDFIGFEIDELTVNQESAYYERQGRKLVVSLDRPLANGEAFMLEVAYHGIPAFEASAYVPFEDHTGMFFVSNLNRLYVVSEPDGSRYWFPCNDHPRDKATFRFEITVPENLVGVANGRLVDTFTEAPNAFPDGRAGDRYVWVEDHPMATYLATVAVGDYVRVEGTSPGGVPLRSYVFANQKAQMEALTPVIGEAVDWMSEHFGPYPFDEFGYVTVNGLGGALENQTMVVLGSLDEQVMIHELAHMWFGDWVSLDSWGDMWRNEGFATYLTALWFARDDKSVLDAQLRSWQMAFDGRSLYPLNDPDPANLFGMESYYGGALLVHALREEIGDEAFFAGLRSYIELYGGGAASPEDFKAEMERAAGRDLSGFFDKWLK